MTEKTLKIYKMVKKELRARHNEKAKLGMNIQYERNDESSRGILEVSAW